MRRLIFLFVLIALGQPVLVFGSPCEKDKKKCGEITLGRPKLWTLDEAHYLVGGVREELKQLRIAYPEGGLNPNEIHRRELEILTSSLMVGAEFDHADRVKAEDAKRKYEQDLEDAEESRERLWKVRGEIASLEDELARNKGETEAAEQRKKQLEASLAELRERLQALDADEEPAADEDGGEGGPKPRSSTSERNQLTAAIALREQELDEVDQELAGLAGEKTELDEKIAKRKARESELETRAEAPTRDKVEATDAKVPDSKRSLLLDEPDIKAALKQRIKAILENDPSLHYTQVLDNLVEAHLQLVSRRLTLLRQSLDPNYELFFVELSASLTPAKRAKNHIARARWKIEVEELDYDAMLNELSLCKEHREILAHKRAVWSNSPSTPSSTPSPATTSSSSPATTAATSSSAATASTTGQANQRTEMADWLEEIRGSYSDQGYRFTTVIERLRKNPRPYIFELTPSQSELNIARTHARAKNFGLLGIFKSLLGLGIRTEYQKQKEQYGQFLERGVFMAGHGKGEDQFGWDFAPMAGEKYVAPGNYTAYAVLAVPKWTKTVVFKTDWSWKKKPSKVGWGGDLVPEHDFEGEKNAWNVQLPTYKDYWVSGLDYRPVQTGEFVTVLIRGRGFSTETMVFVDHFPLDPRLRLAVGEPSDPQGPPVGENAGALVEGAFEVVSSSLIAVRFKRCKEGTPDITLVAPTRSIYLNDLPLRVNREPDQRLDQMAKQGDVFFRAVHSPLRVSKIEFLETNPAAETFSALVQLRGTPSKEPGPRRVLVWNGTQWRTLDPLCEAIYRPSRSELLLTNVSAPQRLILRIERDGPPTSTLSSGGSSGTNGTNANNGTNGDRNGAPLPVVEVIESTTIPYRPVVASLSSTGGPAAGGDVVDLKGVNLSEVESVHFGDQPAELISVEPRQVRVEVPPGTGGSKVLVTATARIDSRSLTSSENRTYSYEKSEQ